MDAAYLLTIVKIIKNNNYLSHEWFVKHLLLYE